METSTDLPPNNTNQDDENAPQEETKSKRIQQPRLKLNAVRLKESRGLPALKKVFADAKFKGRGHEEEDLNALMFRYEYWCHKLFSKLPFDNCLEKIEQLGYERPIQAYIKKVRMDLVDDEEIPTDQINITENDV